MNKARKNILVIKLRYIGDVLLTTPVFEALRSNYPEAHIVALVNKGTEAMLADNPAVDDVLVLERRSNRIIDFMTQLRLIGKLRTYHFDYALELTNSDRGALLSFLSGARRRLGFRPRTKMKRINRRLLLTDLVRADGTQHIVEYHLTMARHLKCSVDTQDLHLYWKEEEEASCRKILKEKGLSLDERFVVMHPFSQAQFKAWHVDSYAAACDYLYDMWGIKTVLVCGNDKSELDFLEKIMAQCKRLPIYLGSKTTLKQLAALMSHAVLFFGVDSGPMHIATAVKTPVVALFGPSRKFRWGPWGDNNTVIQKSWDCVPCGKKGCNGQGVSKCLEELTIGEVINVLDSTLRSRTKIQSE
jgi:heptosyltransferase-3